MIKGFPSERRNAFRLAVIYLATVASVFVLFSPSALAGNSLYDMRSLLAQPHPFARAASSSAAATQGRAAGPGRGMVAPANANGEIKNNKVEENLDLDELPSAKDAETGEIDVNDPLEPLNRAIFGFNEIVNFFILEPVAKTYNFVAPEFVRERISNFLANIKNPVVLVNDLLQGEFERGLETGARLVINSTIGLAGFFDVADEMGFKPHNEDFGQTLAVWGVGEGFYMVLPLLGPSNPRDALGKFIVDSYFDPLGYYVDNTGRSDLALALAGVRGITTYANIVEEMGDLREISIDFYGALRSLFRQRRLAEISNSNDGRVPTIDSYSK